MAVDDIYRITVNSNQRTEAITNTFYFKETVAGPAGPRQMAEDIATAFKLRWEDEIIPLVSADFFSINVHANRIKPTVGPASTSYWSPVKLGTAPEDPLPALAPAVVSYATDKGGASFRGRCYLSGIPQTEADGGILLAAFKTSLQSAVEDLTAKLEPLVGGELEHCVYSRKLFTGELVQEIIVRPAIGTQRRRRPRKFGFSAAE